MATSESAEGEDRDATVWVARRPQVRGDARCYHTDPDCQHVDLSRYREVPRERAQRRDLRECSMCSGEIEYPGAGGPSDHLKSLKAAASANAERDDGED